MVIVEPRGKPHARADQRAQPGRAADRVVDLPGPLPMEAFRGDIVLACAACRQWITSTAMRIEVSGQHQHERANAAGFHFRFGCFAAARGLVLVGDASREHTWFPGWSWQIEHCSLCAQHLGWRFTSPDGQFHGLILDRLVELPSDGGAGGQGPPAR
jgi:hypothetical protein